LWSGGRRRPEDQARGKGESELPKRIGLALLLLFWSTAACAAELKDDVRKWRTGQERGIVSGLGKLVRLHIANDQQTGSVGGIVTVDLPDYQRKLPIYVWGMLVGAKTEVKDFDKEMQRAAELQAKSGAGAESRVAPESRVDLKQAIKQGVAKAELAPPPGNGPLLKWSVAHEELVYGYAIYRSDSEAGPFVRINKDTIRPLPADSGGAYQWRDTTAESGKTYWYYIGVLDNMGAKQQLSGPQKVVAK